MDKIYTGIGARLTPQPVLNLMTTFAEIAGDQGYTLRTGNAQGADRAFRQGSKMRHIFSPKDATEWSFEEVQTCMPTDRGNFASFDTYVQKLLARNMMQVLGYDGDKPSDFLICWAPSDIYTDSSAGGTGYAIRCAIKHGVPVYNLAIPADLTKIQTIIKYPTCSIEESL